MGESRPYLKSDRLADVITLIQIMALGYRHRTEGGLSDDASPRSATDWKEIAREHPEFFRVDDKEKYGVSLVARHVLPKDESGKRELPAGFLSLLIQTAINLHDRQLENSRYWKIYLPPLIGALVGGLFAVGGILLKTWLESCPK